MSRVARLAPCVSAMAVFVAATASAEPVGAPESDPRRAAETLFREGRRAAIAREYAAACAKFAESQALDPSTGTMLNLGDCEEHLGHLLSARNYYQTALAQLGARDPRIPYARQRLAALEERVPRLTIAFASAGPPGMTVEVDAAAVPRGAWGLAVPVDPGEHVIVVTAPRRRDRRETVVLAERESREVLATPGEPDDELVAPVPALPPVRSAETAKVLLHRSPPGHSSPPRTVGWIAGGLGLAGLAMAVLSGMALMRDESTLTDARHCNAQKQCDPEGIAAASDARSWLPVNTASWAVAVAGLGAGTYLLLSSGGASSNRSVVVHVGPTPALGGITGSVSGRF